MYDSDLFSIEQRINEIHTLLPKNVDSHIEDLIQIRKQIELAYKSCSGNEQVYLDNQKARYEKLTRPIAEDLLTLSKTQIENYANGKKPQDPIQFEQGLIRIRQNVENVGNLLPEFVIRPDVQELSAQVEILLRQVNSIQRFMKVKKIIR